MDKLPLSQLIDNNKQLTLVGGIFLIMLVINCLEKGVLPNRELLDRLIDYDN